MADAYSSDRSLTYLENFSGEDEVLVGARSRAVELGCTPISPAVGATLRFLASVVTARAVVEIGGGAGVSGLWLLSGMQPDGVLTSVDTEAEHQRAARQAFGEAAINSARYRLINGGGSEVLPRLTDGAYDLVFIDADISAYGHYYEQAVRLLRPGGVLAIDNMLLGSGTADSSGRSSGAADASGRSSGAGDASGRGSETVGLRELGRSVRDDTRLISTLLPVGDGLLVATKQ